MVIQDMDNMVDMDDDGSRRDSQDPVTAPNEPMVMEPEQLLATTSEQLRAARAQQQRDETHFETVWRFEHRNPKVAMKHWNRVSQGIAALPGCMFNGDPGRSPQFAPHCKLNRESLQCVLLELPGYFEPCLLALPNSEASVTAITPMVAKWVVSPAVIMSGQNDQPGYTKQTGMNLYVRLLWQHRSKQRESMIRFVRPAETWGQLLASLGPLLSTDRLTLTLLNGTCSWDEDSLDAWEVSTYH